MFRFVIFLFIFSFFTPLLAKKEECVKITPCKCRHTKGIVDLSGLKGHNLNVTLGGMEIWYFPCGQVADIGICRRSENNAICSRNNSNVKVWGTQESVKFIVPNVEDYRTIMAEFSFTPPGSGTVIRRAQVYLVCPKKGDTIGTQLKVDNYQRGDITLTLTTEMACFVRPNLWGSGHLLKLELLLMLVSVPVLVSIVALCRYRRGKRGFELIDHKRTPVIICSLFVDGFRTTFCCFPSVRRHIGVDWRADYEAIYDNLL